MEPLVSLGLRVRRLVPLPRRAPARPLDSHLALPPASHRGLPLLALLPLALLLRGLSLTCAARLRPAAAPLASLTRRVHGRLVLAPRRQASPLASPDPQARRLVFRPHPHPMRRLVHLRAPLHQALLPPASLLTRAVRSRPVDVPLVLRRASPGPQARLLAYHRIPQVRLLVFRPRRPLAHLRALPPQAPLPRESHRTLVVKSLPAASPLVVLPRDPLGSLRAPPPLVPLPLASPLVARPVPRVSGRVLRPRRAGSRPGVPPPLALLPAFRPEVHAGDRLALLLSI